MKIEKAVRRALPIQTAFVGPSGSGKTFSALRFAAGLTKTGRVCMINTERGRGTVYADNKKILAELPQGYSIVELDAPYHPKRYIEAIDMVEAAGFDLCLIDSGSDSWDGSGGCTDMAEKAKNMWNVPKLWNKRMMARVANSDMHVLWCLKAQEKTKIIDAKKSASGKQEYIDLGMQPIWEKNNIFPQLLVFYVDPETHLARVTKCTDDLWSLFPEPKLISKADGEAVKRWNEGGAAVDGTEQLQRRARAAAELGMDSYVAFFGGLSVQHKQALKETTHEENKAEALRVDHEQKAPEEPTADEKYNSTATTPQPPLAATIKAIEAFEPELGTKVYNSVFEANFFKDTKELNNEPNAQIVLKAMQEALAKSKGK